MYSHRTTYRVIYGDTDNMGQAYYGNYFRWFEIGRSEMFRSLGLPYKAVEDRALLREIRAQRRVFSSRKPLGEVEAELATLMLMAMEAIEIYVLLRYEGGKKACTEMMMAVARLCGWEGEDPFAADRD